MAQESERVLSFVSHPTRRATQLTSVGAGRVDRVVISMGNENKAWRTTEIGKKHTHRNREQPEKRLLIARSRIIGMQREPSV